MAKTIHALQYDTVDAICWREYGRSSGVVEKVLEANPQLAELGVFLPMGTQVILPDIKRDQTARLNIP